MPDTALRKIATLGRCSSYTLKHTRKNPKKYRKIPKHPEIRPPSSASETRAMIRKPTIITDQDSSTAEVEQDFLHLWRAVVEEFAREANTYNPILKMRRFNVISIYYKNDEFVDLCITDKAINGEDMDKTTSNKCNLPIKKDDGYFKEFSQIIYMENVLGIVILNVTL